MCLLFNSSENQVNLVFLSGAFTVSFCRNIHFLLLLGKHCTWTVKFCICKKKMHQQCLKKKKAFCLIKWKSVNYFLTWKHNSPSLGFPWGKKGTEGQRINKMFRVKHVIQCEDSPWVYSWNWSFRLVRSKRNGWFFNSSPPPISECL